MKICTKLMESRPHFRQLDYRPLLSHVLDIYFFLKKKKKKNFFPSYSFPDFVQIITDLFLWVDEFDFISYCS